jgi:chromosome segregation ATPase
MSNEKTQNLTDGNSFEERIFARFDALESQMGDMREQLHDMDARLQTLEAKAYDTKPIWERALAEILAVGKKLDHLNRKVDNLAADMLDLRARQSQLEDRMDGLETNRAQ